MGVGTTHTSAHVPEMWVFVASPSVVGRSMQSSEKLIIEPLRIDAPRILRGTEYCKLS